MKPEEILEKAAQYIAEHGHCKGALELTESLKHDKDLWQNGDSLWRQYEVGSVCAIGAIRKVTLGDACTVDMKATGLAEEMLLEFVRRTHAPPVPPLGAWQTVPHWNDDEDITAEDVILAMKRAAAGE